MKKTDIKKMIQEELVEALSSQYDTIDKVLNALLLNKISKKQAKEYIEDINNTDDNSRPSVDDCSNYTTNVSDCSMGSGPTPNLRC